MQELEERIQSEGTVKAGNVLKVDAFLNHQCDVRLFDRMGSAWVRHGPLISPASTSPRF